MNITVIGAGKSGMAAAKLAAAKGNKVFLSENQPEERYLPQIEELEIEGVEYEFGGNTEKALSGCDLIITSPGVPPSSWIISTADARGIKVISELEYGYLHLKGNPVIAVTGTNGKTTTTSLINHIVNKSGRKGIAAGNIGTPLCSLVESLRGDEILTLEVSSYQLDRIDTFRPEVALILNITPDHTAYHGSYEHYRAAKWKITKNQSHDNLLVLNGDDTILRGQAETAAVVSQFSLNPVMRGIHTENGKLVFTDQQHNIKEELMFTRELSLPGAHNLYNSMAAALAARHIEIRNEDIRDALMSFDGVEHRLEFVRALNNIRFINDSKATNINAAWYALSSYDSGIVWIAGGQADDNDYSELDELVRSRVKCIICIGDEAESIREHFSGYVPCKRSDTMQQAIKDAYLAAASGDTVLLSPACKSFDWFVNYEHRGQIFKELVGKL